MIDLTNPMFHNEDNAREYFESKRWPHGPWCPHCGNLDPEKITKLQGKKHRAGVHTCNECREQFSVTVGTVMESSHIPLTKWALGFHLMSASKKGVSAHQLWRTLGLGSYRTAWFLCHRIREAMKDAKPEPMGGAGKIIEAHETYHGKRETPRKLKRPRATPYTKGGKSGSGDKRVVFGLVERGSKARMIHIQQATVEEVWDHISANVRRESVLHTDESNLYTTLGSQFAKHGTVKHSDGEYVRGDIHTNTIENVFSVFKRGMHGVYQHCSEAHLHRYLAEFEFRYNRRSKLGIEDTERASDAVRGAEGKRLTYRRPSKAKDATPASP
jgi:transposase-like protein